MFPFERKFFSRDEWCERGRIVVVSNAEAKDVVNLFHADRPGIAGARHVFADDQTVPVEEFEYEQAAA